MDFLEREVLPRLTAETVYSSVDFKSRRGRYYRGACPLHGGDNKTAFSVDTSTLGWTCFSHCGSGSAVAYVNGGTSPRGADFVEAVRKLAELAGVSMPEREPSPEERHEAEERERLEALLLAFLGHARAALMGEAGKAARVYLQERRGFKEEDLEGFGLYASCGTVKGHLRERGFTAEELEASGLLADGRWEGRLVIPWRDRWGRLRTFAARDLTGKAEDAEKYLYLRGTKKADLVAFGLEVALRSKEGRDRLVLVEGLLDVVSLQARDLPNVAAIGGSGREMTPERWEALARFGVRSVTLVLDNDAAGREGTLAALAAAHKVDKGLKVDVLDPWELGSAKDPDEYVRREGLEAFRALLERRRAGAVYAGAALLQDVTPESQDAVKREAVERVARYIETGLRGSWAKLDADAVLEEAARRTDYSPEALEPILRAAADAGRREAAELTLDVVLREAKDAREGGKSALEVGRDLSRSLARLQARSAEPPPPFSVERLELETRELPPGKSSGWEALDHLEVRFHAGELSLAAARTSHGKTSFLVGLLLHWLETAEREKADELFVFYSHEEPEVRIFHRLLVLLTAQERDGWTGNEVRAFLQSPDSRETWPSPRLLEAAKDRLRAWEDRLLVVYRPAWAVDEIAAHALTLSQERKVGGSLVDYLQRVRPPQGKYDRRDIEVSAVGRCLKSLAVDLSAPVVAGAQINREAVPKDYRDKLQGRTYKEATAEIRKARPELSHLREGGSEQEADLVLGLLNYAADYRTEAGATGDHKTPLVTLFEVGALKNRYGGVGEWSGLAFEGRYGRLRDPESHEEAELQVETTARHSSQGYYELQERKRQTTADNAAARERTAAARLQAEKEKTEREKERTKRVELQAAKQRPKKETEL